MERESDARVEELQAMATGSVLFASGGLAESDEATEAPTFAVPPIDATFGPAIDTPAPPPLIDGAALRLNSHDDELDLAWDEMVDETVEKAEKARARAWAPEVRAEVHTQSHPFVLNVPATAGAGQVFSFARAHRRSRT